MERNKLVSALFAVTMATGLSHSALAVEQSPNLNQDQKLLFACTEQVLSIIAAITDAENGNCTAVDGNYDYFVEAGNEMCEINVEGDLGVRGDVTAQSGRGTKIETSLDSSLIVGNQHALNNLRVRQVPGVGSLGVTAFSDEGEILVHNSDFELRPDGATGWEPYDEHVIKDYFWGDVFGGIISCGSCDKKGKGVRDKGLEAITKDGFPRAKWRENSSYREPDFVDGLHSVTKNLVEVGNFAQTCRIRITRAEVTDNRGALQARGIIRVRD